MRRHENWPLCLLFALISAGFIVAAITVHVYFIAGSYVASAIAMIFEPDYPSGL